MKKTRIISFALISLLAGLAAAFIALNFLPDGGNGYREAVLSDPPRQQVGPVSYADAVRQAAPSVVNIFTSKVTIQRQNSLLDDPLFRRFFGDRFSSEPVEKRQNSLGSGVVINKDGYILTNHNVVAQADEIRVVLPDGRELQATVAGADPETDLAVIHTEEGGLPEITVGDSDSLRVGDVVLAIGNPFGVGQTVTMGIVSATGRSQLGINTFENFIQTDAAINPGNSGGALINAYGELVGVNTAIFSKSGGSQGIGFAIPVTLAKGVMNQILQQGRVVRGWLGIAGQDITSELAESFELNEQRGVLISGVLEGGPADKAGLEPGDVITRINNRVPGSAHDILSIVSSIPPGERITVRGWRGKHPLETEVIISERPQQAPAR